MNASQQALVELGRALQRSGYSFVTVTPETHRRVDDRARENGTYLARSLRDVFGWSRPFVRELLPPEIWRAAAAAGVVAAEGDAFRSTVRFSTLDEGLFVHSAYPTHAEDAVFFGPDTYRFCALVAAEVQHAPRPRRMVDIGCGSGAGGLSARRLAGEVILADINPHALAFAEVNVALADAAATARVVASDVLAAVDGDLDLVIANPPYMADGHGRAYRDGGGSFGEALALRIVAEGLPRLAPDGQMIVYTGVAIVDGEDAFRRDVATLCTRAGVRWRYWELDPDVFGEEIEQNARYRSVERIAAVALSVSRPRAAGSTMDEVGR